MPTASAHARPPPGGSSISRFRRLESRLLASHFLLVIITSILLTAIGAAFVVSALDDMNSPTIEQAFVRAAVLAHEVHDRMRVEAGRLFEELPLADPAEEERIWILERLVDRGFDFVVWEQPGRDPFVVEAGTPLPDALPTPSDWERSRTGGTPPPVRGDALRLFDGSGRAVGARMEPDALEAIARTGEDFTRYRQLMRLERIKKYGAAAASAVVFLLASIITFIVARRTARRISRPVTDLAGAVDRLAAGDLSHRANVRADGEIGDLVAAFNRMGDQLERSQNDLIRMERVAAWRDVARRVAHEIRNPLTPIRLAVHRLQGRLPDDDGTRECLSSIGEEIENLTRISETFSEFARMPDPVFAPTDLAAIAGSVVELYRDSVPGVTVTRDAPESLPLVGDRDLLRRALANLVKNAGQALEKNGGNIRVAVRRRGETGMVEVADDGPGVPEEIRDTLFRPGVSGHPGGSGLGLAMVQQIAIDHQGSLQWKPGQPGSVFTIEVRLDLPESV